MECNHELINMTDQKELDKLTNILLEVTKITMCFLEKLKKLHDKILEEIESPRRIAYKPVLKLFILDKWLRNKRPKVNYCRSNC